MLEIRKFLLDSSAYFNGEDPITILIAVVGIFILMIIVAFALRAGRLRKNALVQVKNLRFKVDELENSLHSFQSDLDTKLNEFRSLVDQIRAGMKQLGAPGVEFKPSVEIKIPEVKKEIEKPKVEAASPALATGLKKTRDSFFSRIKSFFTDRDAIDEAALFELEELLLSSDIGVQCSARILQRIRNSISSKGGVDKDELYSELRGELVRVMSYAPEEQYEPLQHGTNTEPRVVLIVGVNGVGKTTTAAKLAKYSKDNGAKPLLVAADTFRAAAVEQLIMWGDRLSIPVVSGPPDSKAATVIFDAIDKAQAQGNDLIIIDTAGRLHTKNNLMQELEGIRNVLKKKIATAPHETLLVVDGITGNNALNQAREFNTITPLTGVIVTKLDGTPKGGIVVAIRDELRLPVRFVGVGEQASDLLSFDPEAFVESLIPN